MSLMCSVTILLIDTKLYKLSLISVFIILLSISNTNAVRLQMKVVKEPITTQNQVFNRDFNNRIKSTAQPSNVSGPEHLLLLKDKCFNTTIHSYMYVLCPFKNATQVEQSLKWNAYKGVIGVWKEWKIVENTFVEMLMDGGDECGPDKRRKTRVQLVCPINDHNNDVSDNNIKNNNNNNFEDVNIDKITATIINVTEPARCEYLIILSTSLVCHPNSLKVYPFLSDWLKSEWEELEGRYANEELTNQGYNRYLNEIFIKANFLDEKGIEKNNNNYNNNNNNNYNSNNSNKNNDDDGDDRDARKGFESLEKCNKEYKKLLNERGKKIP
ncbi:hypothetical protein HELRODRAFT_189974 [Helobdella robusta]|uniref:MRH domain-containing protein n=1 Tax=Helobdella robusta TaxID=6412 RepID=T1FRJ8_HELRO|nr:hypothetical protein HELRODRAFT_189974 [Helobdella robusta]ESN90761.1 hypothetical protein HELRODRAFT_189974 [Helobdella robusta]